jgi:hypothetical protein
LVRIGVPARKVVPFDWPPVVSPSDFSPKREAANADAPRLLYVGQVRIGSDRIGKGVGGLIDATASLVAAGKQC